MLGRFIELNDHPHIALRADLLRSRELPVLAPPEQELDIGTAAATEEVLQQLSASEGCGLFKLASRPPNAGLIDFGKQLGQPMEERSSDVAEFVEQRVLLNVVDRFDAAAPVALQPFSSAALTLHSESSGNPLAWQPRFILLHCVDPGAGVGQAATVLVSMRAVAAALNDAELGLLSQTRYQRCEEGPNIARQGPHGWIFSFRDFGTEPLDWACADRAADPDQVNAAIAALLAALYSAESCALEWQPGLMVVIDNQRWFHGRRYSSRRGGDGRWLQRLRIMETGCA